MGLASLVVVALVGFLIVGAGVLLIMLLVSKPKKGTLPPADLKINIGNLDQAGPDHTESTVVVHGVPVRLAVIVLAPVGRGHLLPPEHDLPMMFENA